jgi:hypothetical protein
MAFGDFTVDRNSAKYVLGSGGSYVSYATDEPAFEFNSDGSYKGLLVEPASTNQIRNGSGTGAVVGTPGTLPFFWSASAGGLTQEIVATGTENGVAYVDIKLSGTASSNSAAIFLEATTTISATDGETWTQSVFLKEIDATSNYDDISFRAYNYTSAPAFVNTNSGSSLTVTTDLERYESTWTLSGATIASSNPAILFFLTNGNSYDFTIRIGWAQYEESVIATSPIPTTTASVTRNKDDINLTSASSLIGQTEGTLYVEVDWRLATGTEPSLLSASDGTTNNRVVIYKNNTDELRMFAQANADIKTNQGASSTGFSGIQKIAFAYKTNDFELYRNGSSVSSDTVGSLAALATLTDIDLGQSYNASNQANMWIRSVALFTRRLSDAECQALTTL